MTTEADRSRLSAIARAHEVYDCLDRIASLRRRLQTLLANHEAGVAGNTKRDCAAFWQRLDELALTEEAKKEITR